MELICIPLLFVSLDEEVLPAEEWLAREDSLLSFAALKVPLASNSLV